MRSISPAVQLFVGRATATLDEYELTDADASLVEDIYRKLDGRHQTLSVTLDWSCQLLSEVEQRVLRRPAICAGDFTLQAAGVVAADVVHPESEIIDQVAELVAKSLVAAEVGDAEPRFRLLETTRSYALTKLMESGEADALGRRHAEYYRDLLESVPNRLAGDPRREPYGSTSLVYGESELVDLDRDELLAALTAITALRKRFPVLNPRASLAEVERYIRGEAQAIECVAGYKYFYLDWNLDIWRCEAWNEPMGSVFDLDRMADQREPCNACMMACYRNASMLMHAAIAASDAAGAVSAGRIGDAVRLLFRRSMAQSMWALAEQAPKMRRLARRRKRMAADAASRSAIGPCSGMKGGVPEAGSVSDAERQAANS
jgi:hypothetical protein